MRVIIFVTVISAASCFGQTASRTLLDHLQGTWQMSGTVMKKPVVYRAEGVWILNGQFLSLHMKDVAVPPTYEATLFIGTDTSKKEYVAHWLDTFGGAGARVVGLGPLADGKIEIVYPYAEGRFRNTFAYDAGRDTWSLTIESEETDGSWSVFARYACARSQ